MVNIIIVLLAGINIQSKASFYYSYDFNFNLLIQISNYNSVDNTQAHTVRKTQLREEVQCNGSVVTFELNDWKGGQGSKLFLLNHDLFENVKLFTKNDNSEGE